MVSQMQKVRDEALRFFLCRGAPLPFGYAMQNAAVVEKITEETVQLLHIKSASLVYFINCHTGMCQHREIYEITVGVVMIEIIGFERMIHRSVDLLL